MTDEERHWWAMLVECEEMIGGLQETGPELAAFLEVNGYIRRMLRERYGGNLDAVIIDAREDVLARFNAAFERRKAKNRTD